MIKYRRTRTARATMTLAVLLMIVLRPGVTVQASTIDLMIELNEYKGSGVTGWAKLTPTIDGMRLTMAVEGTAVTGNHPTHIHTGTCDDFDPNPTYPLTTFILDPLTDDGSSKTVLADISLQKMLADDYVILVHKSMEELTTYFVCGEIKKSNAYVGPRSAGSITVPGTGTGSSAVNGDISSGAPLLASIGALCMVAALLSLDARRRRVPHS